MLYTKLESRVKCTLESGEHPATMTPEQELAGLQDEVRGLTDKVQRLASEYETLRNQSLRNQSTVGESSCKAEQADSLQRS